MVGVQALFLFSAAIVIWTPGVAYALGDKLVFTTEPTGTTDGLAWAGQPIVTLETSVGATVTSDSSMQVTLAISTQPAGGGTLTCTTNPVTAVAGVVNFSNAGCELTGAVGNYKISATAAPSGIYTSATSSTLSLGIGAASKLTFDAEPSAGTIGVTLALAPKVWVEDVGGNVVASSSDQILLAIATQPTSGATLTCTTNPQNAASGKTTFSGCKIAGETGSYSLIATDETLNTVTTATSASFTLSVGAANKLAFMAQPSGALDGATFSPDVQVKVEDVGGNLVSSSSASISLAISTHPGSGAVLSCGANPVSAISGVADFSGCSITGATGNYVLSASSGGLTVGTSNAITLTPAAASQLAFSTPPGGGVDGLTLSASPVVQVQDLGGNVIASSVVVTLAINSAPVGGGVLTCANNAVTSVAGVATFSNCVITGVIGAYTLVATAPGLSSVTSAVITLTIGAASQLVFQTEPAGTTDAKNFTTQPRVWVEDVGGNVVTLSNASIDLTIATQPASGATLNCTTNPQNAVSGKATFAGCAITGTVGDYSISATDAADLLSVTSVTFTLLINTATNLVVLSQPTGAVDGATFSPDPVVALEDIGGNIETATSSGSVTLAINTQPGTGTLTCDLNTVAVAAGEADFTNCALTGTVGSYTLKATKAGVTTAITTAITLTIGAASQLVFTSSPVAMSTSASPTGGPVTVVLEDVGGNPTTDPSNVSVWLSSTSIGGSFASSPGGADVNTVEIYAGQEGATFYYGDTVSGEPTIEAGSSGFQGVAQLELITPGAASGVVIVTESFSVALNTTFSVQAQIVDAFGNPVADDGVSVSLSTNPSAGLGASMTLPTGADGSVIFDNLTFDSPGVFVLSASAPSLSSNLSRTLLVTVLTGATVPGAPGAPFAMSSSQSLASSVQLYWNAPGNGGSSITAYTVTPFDETLGVAGVPVFFAGDVTSTTITGLVPGDAYDFSVVASNAIGASSASPASNSVEPVLVLPVVTLTASSMSETGTATLSAGSTSAVGSITVSATGRGTITVSRFAAPPIPNAPSSLTYFDVAITPGSNFLSVTFQICGVVAGGEVQWRDPLGQTFVVASDQSMVDQSTGCDSVIVTSTSTPSISELYGSIFAAPLSVQNPATPSYAVTVVVSHLGASVFGAPVTYRATLSSSALPIGSGTVVFTVGARVLCSARVTNNVATCTSSSAPRAGELVVVGTYKEASGYIAGRGRGHVVIKPEAVTIVVQRNMNGNPGWTILVEAKRPGTHQPTGRLVVLEDGVLVGVALRNGTASLNLHGTFVRLDFHGGRDFQTKQIIWRV